MTTRELRVPEAEIMPPEELQRFLAAKLFEADKISLGYAAELAGCTYREFIDVLTEQGIPWARIDDAEDFRRELEEMRGWQKP